MTLMPQTAEAAHAVARQHYKAMLHHADAGRDNMAGTAAGCFQNAALLAQMYELRQIRIALLRIAGPTVPKPLADTGWVRSTEDSHEYHAPPSTAPHDGFAVPGRRMT